MSRTATALQIDIVRLEDKESKLKAFIQSLSCVNTGTGASPGINGEILLVARSASSPVAKAIAALAREGVLDGPVRAVFLLDTRDSSGESLGQSLDLPLSVRIAADLRVSDAHEQLVVGPTSSWFGDCMRRDPMKRDAYECYAANCTKTATWARISFERLWAFSKPAPTAAAMSALAPAEPCHAGAAAESALADAMDPASQGASHTRHD